MQHAGGREVPIETKTQVGMRVGNRSWIVRSGRDYIDLAWARDQWRALVTTAMNLLVTHNVLKLL
jgi:hypothetical protein